MNPRVSTVLSWRPFWCLFLQTLLAAAWLIPALAAQDTAPPAPKDARIFVAGPSSVKQTGGLNAEMTVQFSAIGGGGMKT